MKTHGAGAELRDRRRLALTVSLLLNFVFLLALHFGTAPNGRLEAGHAQHPMQSVKMLLAQ